ncbi:MAG: hypothetical protein WC829_01235 [Hyphomicrobium sp.]|jgi:hypothetical protein
MTQRLGATGLNLPLPQNLYPTQLNNAPPDVSTNRIALAPGDTLPIPAGDWFVNLGQYCVFQFLDPVTNIWNMGPNAAWQGGHQFVVSDGFNVRVANLLGCPLTASVTSYGSSYVQATTTITATPGNSTWVPIVGGQLTPTIISAGAGYGVAPEIFIPAPAPAANNANGVGGIQASAWANISSGTLTLASGVSMTNPGAGYSSPFTIALLPSPTDPNLSTGITMATVVFSVTGSGSLTGALCTNPGAPLSNPNQFTLTVAGAGTQATVVGNVLQTVTAASVTGAGSGYGTVSALLTTVGGVPAAGTITNSPEYLGLAWRPRPANIALAVTAAANGTLATQVGTIYDGGLFLTNSAPATVFATTPTTATTVAVVGATLSMTMGSRPDIVTLQPAP